MDTVQQSHSLAANYVYYQLSTAYLHRPHYLHGSHYLRSASPNCSQYPCDLRCLYDLRSASSNHPYHLRFASSNYPYNLHFPAQITCTTRALPAPRPHAACMSPVPTSSHKTTSSLYCTPAENLSRFCKIFTIVRINCFAVWNN